MSNTKFKKVELTAKKARCAKCVNCINNTFRLRMDDPKVEDWEKFSCSECYLTRLREKDDITLLRISAVEALCRVIFKRYHRMFLDMSSYYTQQDWLSVCMARHDIADSFSKILNEIANEKTKGRLEFFKRSYDEEYFGKGSK